MVIAERGTTHNEISQSAKPETPNVKTVEIGGFIFTEQEYYTRREISQVMRTSLNAVSARLNKLENQGILQPVRLATGNRSRLKFYTPTQVGLMIPVLKKIKPRLSQPGYESSNPENFFTFRDGTTIRGIDAQQKSLLELAAERTVTTLQDLKEKGIIKEHPTLYELQNLFAHLDANMEETPWRLENVPDYCNPETAKREFAFTIVKTGSTEQAQSKIMTKKELAELKEQVLKHAVRDILDEIIQSKTNVNYNVRVRLGNHLPPRTTMYTIFGDVSDQMLNNLFVQAFKSVFRNTKQPNSKTSKNGHKPQPDPIHSEIQEKVSAVRQKKGLNIVSETNYIKRSLAYTVYQAKEKD